MLNSTMKTALWMNANPGVRAITSTGRPYSNHAMAGVNRARFINRHGKRALAGLGDISDLGTDETGFDWAQVPNWIRDITLAYNTQQLLKLNMERAAMGLPPITSASVAPTMNFGLSAETQKLLMYGGIALVAAYVLMNRKKA